MTTDPLSTDPQAADADVGVDADIEAAAAAPGVTGQTGWRTAWIGLEAQDHWLRLFETCFGHRPTPQWLAWKYSATPNQMGMGVWSDDRLVGFYGGLPRRVQYLGRPGVMAVQIGDVMVAPDQRGVLSKRGPFFLSCSGFLAQKIGFEKDYLVGFGFPSRRHMVLAQRLGLNAPVDSVVELSWNATLQPTRWLWGSLYRLQALAELAPDVVDTLWRAMAADFGRSIIGVRDWTTIKHRYVDHPSQRYGFLFVGSRLTGRPLALVVTRSHGADGEGDLEVIDVIGSRRHLVMGLRWARHWAAQQGLQRVFCWITRSHVDVFGGTGYASQDTEVQIPCNTWSPGPDAASLQGKWFLMGGDSDFR